MKGLAALVLLSGCALVLPQASLEGVPRGAPLAGPIRAGAARIALTPVDHPVPLAGFGPNPARTTAEESPLHARAVSLRGAAEIASGVDRVVLVSVDMLVVPRPVANAVRERLSDLQRTEVILCATHTHEGIGGFWRGGLPEWGSVGRYDAAETARVVSRIALCVHEAVKAERPARLAIGAVERGDLVESRVSHSHATDKELLALALDDAEGKPIARLVFFAAHPTELYGVELLSPAWPGAFSRELEKEGGVALLFQQGVGEQRPAFPPEVYEDIAPVFSIGRVAKSHAYGKVVAKAARAVLGGVPRLERATLRLARAPYDLPPPSLGACPIPLLDRAAALPVVLPYWPRRTHLWALRAGSALLAFAPFELCAPTANRAKRELHEAGFSFVATVSLAGDWLGYAPDFVPIPWTTSGALSFGGIGLGRSVGDRIVELGARLSD